MVLPEEAFPYAAAHACITEQLYVVDAVRKHMRVLLTPSDDADLHQLSETARAIEANLGEACAREYMENTLAAYGSGRFFCTVCAQTRAPRGGASDAVLMRRRPNRLVCCLLLM